MPRRRLGRARHRRPACSALGGVLVALLTACAGGGGPGGGPDDDGVHGPIAIERFHLDRYAIGAKWYQYAPDGHLLMPYPDAYVLRLGDEDPPRYVAMRIVSYYDRESGGSGLFTLGFATWDGASWSGEEEWVSPRNVKDTGPLCVDVLARAERDCASSDWHLAMRTFSNLSPLSQIVVNNPGLFVRSHAGVDGEGRVHVAKLAGRETLSGLPPPSSLQELDDGPCASWEDSDWDFSRFAPNVPERGLLLGQRFVDEGFTGRDDVYFLVNGRFTLARFSVRPTVDGDPAAGLTFTYSVAPIDRAEASVSTRDVAVQTAEIAAPAEGEVVYLAFPSEPGDLLADPARVEEGSWPHLPPFHLFWDLALERLDDGALRFVLSPASGLLNGTDALGAKAMSPFEDAWPPLSTE